MDSEQYIYQGNFRHSILESVIAMEYVVSKFILKKCIEKEISKSDVKKYIKDVGLSGNIKTTIKLLLDEIPVSDEIFKKCRSSITIRNNIVHKGQHEVDSVQAEDAYQSSRQLIKFLISYI